MGRVPARVDFLQRLPGIELSEAWLRRVVVDIAGIAISFIGREDLIANKRAVGEADEEPGLLVLVPGSA